MAYTRQTWADYPDTSTPITAARLTHIEQGIFDAAATADAGGGAVSSVNGLTGAVSITAAGLGAITQAAADGRYPLVSTRNAANGYAGLDATGKVLAANLPAASGGGTITSVNGQTGPAVTLVAGDVGALTQTLGDARYLQTSAAFTQTLADARYPLSSAKGQANGFAGLDSAGLVPAAQLPAGGGGGGAVTSVNGDIGDVIVDTASLGAYTAAEVDALLSNLLHNVPAVIRYNTTTSTWAGRATVTADVTRTVIWIGVSAPAIGGVGAVNDVDIWIRTP